MMPLLETMSSTPRSQFHTQEPGLTRGESQPDLVAKRKAAAKAAVSCQLDAGRGIQSLARGLGDLSMGEGAVQRARS